MGWKPVGDYGDSASGDFLYVGAADEGGVVGAGA